MLPSSHQIQINLHPAPIAGAELAGAFSEFMSASARLEFSYRELQEQVQQLTLALSERNRALSESRSENRSMGRMLERILEAMPCGVLVVNANGSVRLANPEAARLLNIPTVQDCATEGIRARPGVGPELRCIYESAGEFEQELSFETPAGTSWIAARKVPLAYVNGTSIVDRPEAVLMLRDISTFKRIEQERERARDSVALAQVSAVLAHEIRNPLASLELFAGLITDNPETSDEWLSHLRAGIRSLAGTVNNVLTIHGGANITLQRINVAMEAALSVSFLQPLARQAGVDLQLQAEWDEIWCQSNTSAFQQILLNLCTNALRHTSPGGVVRVVCSAPEGPEAPVRIEVVDTGRGIADEHLEHLFEAGFSGSGVTPGLGLAVCERLVRQHGGIIHVTSRVGHGSTFTLEFPQA